MTAFDGTTCPEEHIMEYINLMLLYTTNSALLCKFLPTTLTALALIWYTSPLVWRINTFAQLKAKLQDIFVASKKQEKSNFHLQGIMQLEGEYVSTYLKSFHEVVLEETY